MLLYVKMADAEKNGNFTDVSVSKVVGRSMFSYLLRIIFFQCSVYIKNTCIPAVIKELEDTF